MRMLRDKLVKKIGTNDVRNLRGKVGETFSKLLGVPVSVGSETGEGREFLEQKLSIT